MKIDNHSVLTLVDLGASRTCAKAGAKFLYQKVIQNDSTIIIAANYQQMNNYGTCNLTARSNDFVLNLKPLIIQDLSYDLILGMDAINSIEYDKNQHHAIINGHKINRYLPGQQTVKGKLIGNITIPPTLDFRLKVKNPLYGYDCKLVEVESTSKILSNPSSEILVNSSIHNNEPEITIHITNFGARNINISKRDELFAFKPVYQKIQSINGIKILKKCPEEKKNCRIFQSKRKQMYFQNDFVPEIGLIGETLSDEQKIQLKNLLKSNRMAFAANPNDLGKLHYFKFTMPLKEKDATAYESPRPVPYGIQPKVEKQIQTWLDQEIIEVSSSRHNIPLLIIKKNDGTIRTSLDARKLNNLLVPDRFPLPNLREVIHQLGRRIKSGTDIFITQLDLSRGYWQMCIDKPDRSNLAFSFKNKQYVSNRCLYGVSTIPAAFCRMVNEIFAEIPDTFIYLDDIAVVSTSWKDHVTALDQVFTRAIQFGLNLSGKKSRFACQSMDFLGFYIDKNGVRSSQKHVDKISNYPTPESRAELRKFLGVCAFTSKMVRSSSTILAPLHKLCSSKKHKNFDWTEEHEMAFNEFKKKLSDSTGLHHRDEKLPLVLCTDASLEKFGAVLYQKNNQDLEPLAFHSGLFSNAERRLSSRHRELLAITFSIRHFEYDLVGNHFDIITDHQSLINILSAKSKNELSLKLVNAIIYLMNFEFSVTHQPGKSDVMAVSDALSRTKITKQDLIELSERNEIPEKLFFLDHLPASIENTPGDQQHYLRSHLENLRSPDQSEGDNPEKTDYFIRFAERELCVKEFINHQAEDSKIANIKRKLELGCKRMTSKYLIENDVVYRILHKRRKPVLPEKFNYELLEYIHITFGHCGNNRLIKIVKNDLYLFNIIDSVKQVTSSCLSCAKSKPRPPLKSQFTKPRKFAAEPWSTTHWDLWDAGSKDRRGKRYVLAVTDELTKFTDMIPIATKTEETVAKAMIDLILRHSMFNSTIITDNGKEFTNQTWKIVTEKLSNFHITTSPFNSRGNSNIERKFRDFSMLLRVNGVSIGTWSENINYILFYMNNCPKESLGGLTPSEALYGRSITLIKSETEPLPNEETFTKYLDRWLKSTHANLLRLNEERFGKLMTKHCKVEDLTDQKCVVFQPTIRNGKLSVSWDGPYQVIRSVNPNSYLVERLSDGRRYRRHVRHLRPLAKASINMISESLSPENNEDNHIIPDWLRHIKLCQH